MKEHSGQDPTLDDINRLLDGPEPDEAGWYNGIRTLLETAYLAAADPFQQSGMRADAAHWEQARRPIAAAIDHDGTFLDIGCANGLLMESLVTWAAEAGHRIEPYGLDYSSGLADLARRRLPRWADRIFVGNAIDWQPPRRFDYVRTELVYVPPARQPAFVERLLLDFLNPGGRLIVCHYGSTSRRIPADDVAAILRSWGYAITGEATGQAENGVAITRVTWVDVDHNNA